MTARIPEAYQWLLTPVQASPQTPVTWQADRLTGQDALAVRASKKLRSDDLLVTTLAGTVLRTEMDKIPLWRGDHVAVKQLVEDFARYPYLPRLKGPEVLLAAIREGLGLLLWMQESFAYADSYDEEAQRYRGLRAGELVTLSVDNLNGLLVKPAVAQRQLEAERQPVTPLPSRPSRPGPEPGPEPSVPAPAPEPPPGKSQPRRFHGSVVLDATRAGRDAGKIADEVIAHLVGLVGANVTVTLEIEAELPNGAPEHVVRTVTENARTLKFTSQGFEEE